MSTRWCDVTVGETVIVDGQELEVRSLHRGKMSIRVVLADADPEAIAAKVALKVALNDEVGLPDRGDEGAQENVKQTLGGEVLGQVTTEGQIVSPVMDVTTIAAHLKVMHGVTLTVLDFSDEEDMLRIHQELHDTAPYHEPAIDHTHESQ